MAMTPQHSETAATTSAATPMIIRRVGRKSCFRTLLFSAATVWQTSSGFLVGPSPSVVSRHRIARLTEPLLSTTSALPASASSSTSTKSSSPTNLLQPAPARLSAEEQLELLRQTVEWRRIQKAEQELKLTSKLQLSRQTGYGEELDALDHAIAQGELARERLVTTNMGLVHYCINDITKRKKLDKIGKDDLLQEGAIGLARAVDKWNPAIGGKFSTYAYYWIRAAILRCLAEHNYSVDPMRIPEHIQYAISKIYKASHKLGIVEDAWQEAAAAKALAEEAGLSDSQMQEALKVRQRRNRGGVLSFESWMQQGRDYETDLLSAKDDDTVSQVDATQMKQALARYLRPREMEALSWRYGLNNSINKQSLSRGGKRGEAMSFVEVGKHMQVSAEYGRKLCHQALNKLRQAAEEGTLEPAFLM